MNENLIATITNPAGCEGTAYRITLPDGRSAVVDETGDTYAELAGILDDIFEGVPA